MAVSGLQTPQMAQPSQPAIDTTVTHIHVTANGTAVWEIEMRTRLETDSEADVYRNFQSAFRNNTSVYITSFERQMRTVVAQAANTTNRTMDATNFTGTTSIQTVPRRWGVVTYRFEWHGFADVYESSLSVGDVFEGGYYLGENDVLTIHAPTTYKISYVQPAPKTNTNYTTVSWAGPLDFNDRHPSVTFVPTAPSTTPSPGDSPPPNSPGTATTPPSTTAVSPGGSSPPASPSDDAAVLTDRIASLALGALLIALVCAAGYYRLWQRDRSTHSEESIPPASTDDDMPDEPTSAIEPPHEYLTDSERVIHLLKQNDGRIPQAEIGDELGWSASKTSRILSEMVEADDIRKLKRGRKNLIELPDESPDE